MGKYTNRSTLCAKLGHILGIVPLYRKTIIWGGGVHYKRRPFLSPGKFYNQSIMSKKQVQKVLEKLKVSLGIQKTLKLLAVMKSRNYQRKCPSPMRCLWNRPTGPGQVSHFDRTGGQIRVSPSNRSDHQPPPWCPPGLTALTWLVQKSCKSHLNIFYWRIWESWKKNTVSV